MNDKFWDLKKAKQDKMINGALKIFARNGFRHASTDEIVAEASISKGLLFHYFYSKAGLYAFLTEYSARFAMVELNSELRRREDLPFFDFQYALTKAEALIMRQYPYMLLFMENAGSDIEADTYDLTKEHLSLYRDRLDALLEMSASAADMPAEDAKRIDGLLRLVRLDRTASLLKEDSFSPDRYVSEVTDMIRFMEKLYNRS
ncbi:MAG: TetR/AcrR family transcriptional regulator [Lachnospiraceae bacterium]|nr:TetR/AcrR family transcriptional regulator [Lachnospiraceae bacterium]